MHNPPAFPLQPHLPVEYLHSGEQMISGQLGMSLRDWFAGMALQGKIAHSGFDPNAAGPIAHWCYQQAEAMLKIREGNT